MRVLIVDDSAFMRKAIAQMLASDPQIQVVGTARNGKEGVEMATALRPDVITMDIEMPEMDGLTALQHIMRACPTAVLMLSSLTTEGSHAALRALKLGAADVLAKDTSQISLSITNIREDLLSRVHALAHEGRRRAQRTPVMRPTVQQVPGFRPGKFDVICIGSSTGGPPVLETILTRLPASLSTPVVVAQHMPEMFTRSLAQHLAEDCNLRVLHVEDHMPLERRTIYIAPGGKNIHLHKLGLARWEMRINREPASTIYWPSVDALLLSAVASMGSRALGVVLTGIGDDGYLGGKELHTRGGTLLTQSAETCVVYGMPKKITENALALASLSPDEIASALCSMAEPPTLSRAG